MQEQHRGQRLQVHLWVYEVKEAEEYSWLWYFFRFDKKVWEELYEPLKIGVTVGVSVKHCGSVSQMICYEIYF